MCVRKLAIDFSNPFTQESVYRTVVLHSINKHMSSTSTAQVTAPKTISIQGARVHNLKNISLDLPRRKLIVFTGVSGSGKSSLAFDTLFAEGQRRYVESLSSYARQFLGRLDKPNVDNIKGIPPAVAIEQKVTSRNPRSTVGTTTEIYDYFKVLFARIGKTYSPVSGKEVKRHHVGDVLKAIHRQIDGRRLYITAPIYKNGRTLAESLKLLQQQGFSRLLVENEIVELEDALKDKTLTVDYPFQLVIDRAIVRHNDEDNDSRLADSIQTAFYEGHGTCNLIWADDFDIESFSNLFEADGISFEEPNIHFFSFNNPYGACPRCEGFGSVIGIDEDLVIPNQSLSVYDGCVVAWKGEKMSEWRDQLVANAHKFDFPIHRAYHDLSEEEQNLLWEGNNYFKGINDFFKYLESKSYKIQYRVMLSRYRGKTKCPECKGLRLRKEASFVKVGERSITELAALPIDELQLFFGDLKLSEYDRKVSKRLLVEINNRLKYLVDVGLGYLTLNRVSNSLSGGESQRINLATSLGSSLVGSLYILDEPSIGLHPKDTENLIRVVKELRDLGNTVIVVEHDEEFMHAADYIVDIGPGAGSNGGEIVAKGDFAEITANTSSLTGKYLTGVAEIPLPKVRRKAQKFIEVKGAREHNLKGIDAKFPLHCFTVVTGVSGSGKSTLVSTILHPALRKKLTGFGDKPGKFSALEGHADLIEQIEFVDQNPIGKSSRSNPVTYLKAYDEIRSLYANQKLSKVRGYKPKHFSFNTDGGRCDTCKGEGEVVIEMQFMADVHLVCEDCDGKRFKDDILEIEVDGKNIFDILELTVNDAINFFAENGYEKIVRKLQPLQDVGLGYIHLGQSSSTLSGGEAQRVKLASFLAQGNNDQHTLFIFDEPTTGLHFDDINKLLDSFTALLERGHSIVVIEHNPDVIKCADWIIDLGPGGGKHGGNLVFQGTPEELIENKDSETARFIAPKLKQA
jgi:excinuclease ABC subunit A